ncbi:MAG TPA: mechanosensitive ion channel family protein [Bryobacteraceae bacterium]|nr:mechanosensitive ion channel family protein [Bryobacteraceae bacterium]
MIRKIFVAALAAAWVVSGQTPPAAAPSPAPAPAQNDPLGRTSPQNSIYQFLEAAHSNDYFRAQRYLDLRSMSTTDRAKQGPDLAKQLEDLLDDTGFDIATLSRDAEGYRSDDLPPQLEHLASFRVGERTVDLQMEKVTLRNGLRVWVISADSVKLIPDAHKMLTENWFEKQLPQQLVTIQIFQTPIWRWIALFGAAILLWLLVSALSLALTTFLHSRLFTPLLRGPLRLMLGSIGFRLAIELAPPSSIPRLFLERFAGLAFSVALAWAVGLLVDILAERWHSHLDPRVQAISYSILPLGRQIVKATVYLIVLLSMLNAWGISISTVLAGIGVGGIAVALAAQKTIENLFGGISVIGDRPVLVGDFCRWGNQVGTVIDIGLRSTRIRTLDRTVVSIPNGQFSSMQLENFSSRDKIWFHPTLNLRKDTTSAQLQKILADCVDILKNEPKAEIGSIPVRFIGPGPYSLDVEIFAYITTPDFDEFLGVQQRLLLKIVEAVEAAGSALAVPWQQSADTAGAAELSPNP